MKTPTFDAPTPSACLAPHSPLRPASRFHLNDSYGICKSLLECPLSRLDRLLTGSFIFFFPLRPFPSFIARLRSHYSVCMRPLGSGQILLNRFAILGFAQPAPAPAHAVLLSPLRAVFFRNLGISPLQAFLLVDPVVSHLLSPCAIP